MLLFEIRATAHQMVDQPNPPPLLRLRQRFLEEATHDLCPRHLPPLDWDESRLCCPSRLFRFPQSRPSYSSPGFEADWSEAYRVGWWYRVQLPPGKIIIIKTIILILQYIYYIVVQHTRHSWNISDLYMHGTNNKLLHSYIFKEGDIRLYEEYPVWYPLHRMFLFKTNKLISHKKKKERPTWNDRMHPFWIVDPDLTRTLLQRIEKVTEQSSSTVTPSHR